MVGSVNSEDQDKRVPVRVTRAFKSWMVGDTAGFSPTESKLLVDQGYGLFVDRETGKVIQPEPEPAPEPEVVDEGIAIPKDWESLPFLSQVQIAKKIDPNVEGTKEPVHAAIKAELDRRGGADPTTQTPNQE